MADRKLQILIRTQFDGKGAAQAEREMSGLSRSMGQLGKVAGAVGATGLLLKIGKDAIQTASDIQEMRSKFDTVFGSSSGSVTSQLKEFSDQANRSIYDLQGFAAGFQDTFVPLGFARERAAELSVDLVKLTEDLASFNNLDSSDVAANLSSALVGNHEAVRSFGIVITETVMKAELAASGWDKLTGAALEQAKVQARLNIIMRSTTDAQGDAIRTSDSYANQVKGMEAAWSEFLAVLGTAALPTATAAVTELAAAVKQISTDIKPSIAALSGEYNTAVGEMIDENLAAADSMETLVTEAERFSSILGRTGFAAGAVGTFDALREGIVGTGREMAIQADSLEEYEQGLARFSGLAATTFDTHLATLRLTVEEYYNLVRAGEAVESSDRAMLNAAQNVSYQARDAAESIRAYHQSVAEARGPNEELADKQGQLAARISETEGAMRAANAANQALVDGLREQKEAAIAANAALVDAFRSQDTTDAIQSLLSAQKDLADSQGEWVTAVRTNSGQIADINSQLATDLSDEQKRAYQEILNTVGEGSAEWLSAYNALQGDLTESQRAALVAQRAELEASGDQIVNVYTGDAAAAEDAQERIEAANAALIESYRKVAFEGSLALAELSPDPDAIQRTLDYAVAIGAISQEEADLRLEAAQTRLALDDLNTQVVQNGLDTAVAAEAFRLLTEGEAGSAAEAITLAQNLLGVNDQLAEIPGDYTAKVEADTAAAETGLKAVEEKLSQINGRTARAYVVIEESIQSSQQDQSVVGSGGNGGGGRAFGGAVFPNQSYIVGERGPEIFRPSSTGTIIPHNQLGTAIPGGGDTINIYTQDRSDTVVRQMQARNRIAVLTRGMG